VKAQRVAGEKELSSDVLAEILERTDGVQLFLEELTKGVLDARASGAGGGLRPEAEAHYPEAIAIAEQLGMAPVRAWCLDRLIR
jgi:hypothetical protein